jgi:hypothetical protein
MTLAMMAGFQNLCQVEVITIPEDGNDDNNIALLGKFLIQVSLLSFFLHDNIYLIIFIFFYVYVRTDKNKYC